MLCLSDRQVEASCLYRETEIFLIMTSCALLTSSKCNALFSGNCWIYQLFEITWFCVNFQFCAPPTDNRLWFPASVESFLPHIQYVLTYSSVKKSVDAHSNVPYASLVAALKWNCLVSADFHSTMLSFQRSKK